MHSLPRETVLNKYILDCVLRLEHFISLYKLQKFVFILPETPVTIDTQCTITP